MGSKEELYNGKFYSEQKIILHFWDTNNVFVDCRSNNDSNNDILLRSYSFYLE